MQRIPSIMKDGSQDNANDFVPSQLTIMDIWLKILDGVVRVLTFGKGRVVQNPGRIIRWNGEIR